MQDRELRSVLDALSRTSVPVLLLKGAAWAYTLYDQPVQRPRQDTDLFIDRTERERAAAVLESLGYVHAIENTMEVASSQRHYSRRDRHGVVYHVDLHWHVTDRLVFRAALPHGRVWRRSTAIAALPGGRTLRPVDALQLAAVHRVAHHGEGSCLLWLLDVHLLADALSPDDWAELTIAADASGLRGCLARALQKSAQQFGTAIPADVRDWVGAGARDPMDGAFAADGVRPLAAFSSDWRAACWRDRAALLRDHAFPPVRYIRRRYGADGVFALSIAYARRLARGVPAWLSR